MNYRMQKLGMLVVMIVWVVPGFAQHKIAMKSGVLEFREISKLVIEGHQGSEVIIETEGEYKIPERAKGLRPIGSSGLADNTGLGLAVKEEASGHQVVYQVARNTKTKYVVKIPAGITVKYINSSVHAHDFYAKNVSGEIEVKTQHADIKLVDVTGPVALNSVHGDIDIVFTSVNTELPSSLAVIHGDVDVAIPASTGADLSLSCTWGEIYSDLDLKVDSPEGMKIYGAKNIKGKLNGGGVAMSISSTHGNIYLRKK